MAAARKCPREALGWFSAFEAPFAGKLFNEAARLAPLCLLEIAMQGTPHRFNKIRELIWKEIDYDPKWGGTLWTVKGRFMPEDVVVEFRQQVEELFGTFQARIRRTLGR